MAKYFNGVIKKAIKNPSDVTLVMAMKF